MRLLSVLVGLLASAAGLRAVWLAGQAKGFDEGSFVAAQMWRAVIEKDLREGRLVLADDQETGDFGTIPTGADHMWGSGRLN